MLSMEYVSVYACTTVCVWPGMLCIESLCHHCHVYDCAQMANWLFWTDALPWVDIFSSPCSVIKSISEGTVESHIWSNALTHWCDSLFIKSIADFVCKYTRARTRFSLQLVIITWFWDISELFIKIHMSSVLISFVIGDDIFCYRHCQELCRTHDASVRLS